MYELIVEAVPALRSAPRDYVINTVVLWSFRGINSKILGIRLSKAAGVKVNPTAVTSVLLRKSELLQYKAAILAEDAKYGGIPQTRFSRVLGALSRTTLRHVRKLRSTYKPMSHNELELLQEDCCRKLHTWLAKFTYRKMRFLQSQRLGLTLEDLQQELLYKALQGFTLMWPYVESPLHALNVMKRTAHNHGINLIKHYTREKNSVLVSTESSTTSRMVSLDEIVDVAAPARDDDLRIDIANALKRYKGKKRLFIWLMAGRFSTRFSLWLGKANDELFERIAIKNYLKKVVKWLDISMDAAQRFLHKLSIDFAAYAGV